jgi:DNA cross-link repair 1A protein
MNPKFIFPHVNNDGGENAKRMLTLLRASEDEYAEMRRGR